MARMMKDSGIDWLGTIPETWEVVPLKYKVKLNQETLTDSTSPDYEFDYVEIGSVNLIDGIKSYEHMKFVDAPSRARRIIKKDDIIVSTVRTYLKAIAKVPNKENLVASTGFAVLTPCNINANYLGYMVKTNYFTETVTSHSVGVSYPAINANDLVGFKILVPPLEEQSKIARFLDERIGEVDTIISKTKESIEEYKKYKQAVITEVALGGLNKAVTTKSSGIDWIGNIPEHWKIKPFKFVMTERNEKNIPVKTDERLALSIDKGITTYAEKTTNLDRFKDDVTQYKLAYEGDLVFNSMNMIVGAIGYSNYFGCVSPVYYTYYDNVEGHYTSKYYEYIFRSKTMRKVLFSLGKGIMAIDRGDDKINTCRLKVSRDDLRCLKVPVPTEREQQEIVKYLDAKCAEIDALIAKKEAFVEEMEAYKKSLIYEYVTGKKEVL